LVWLVKTRHSILKFLKEFFLKERMSSVPQNSKFYNTKTILRSLSLKRFPWWSLTQIAMIQIGLESKLDSYFYFLFFLKVFFPSWATRKKRATTIKWSIGHLRVNNKYLQHWNRKINRKRWAFIPSIFNF